MAIKKNDDTVERIEEIEKTFMKFGLDLYNLPAYRNAEQFGLSLSEQTKKESSYIWVKADIGSASMM